MSIIVKKMFHYTQYIGQKHWTAYHHKHNYIGHSLFYHTKKSKIF